MRSEFDFIQHIKKKYALKRVGDDCAVLPKDDKTDMVVTTDLLVEDIDFRLELTTPEFLGHKALAVSLSDVAAMGAEPTWALLSIGVPENLWNIGFIDKFYEGWFDLATQYGLELVGGDVSRAPDKFLVDSGVGGEVPKGQVVLRSTAKVGDAIFVSGPLGGAAGGLQLLETGVQYVSALVSQRVLIGHQLKPTPRADLAATLREIASAMIDVSDGLSSDLAHLCEASGVGAEIENVPINDALLENFDNEEAFQLALHGGEDFELLFTVPQEKIFQTKNLRVVRVGQITSDTGKIELIRGGEKFELEPKGYRHF